MKNPIHPDHPQILPFILSLSLLPLQGLTAGILLTEGFETDGEGVRYVSTSSFTDGAGDYFTRTDGTTEATGIPPYTGFSGTYFWAAEDTDSTDNPTGLAQIDFSGIDLTGFTAFEVSLDIGAGSNSAFDRADDFVLVQYRFDAGTWQTALAFENNGQTFNSGLHQDIDLDGIGEGVMLGLAFQTITSPALPSMGTIMDLRIDMVMTSDAEAVGFDNIQVTGVPEPASTALSMAVVACFLLLVRRRFLPQREIESRA